MVMADVKDKKKSIWGNWIVSNLVIALAVLVALLV